MNGVKHSKITGLLAVMALLAVTGLVSAVSDIQPLAPQTVDITTKTVTLYYSPDSWDDTGEIFVKYNTGSNIVTTGIQTVVADSQTYNWHETPYSWANLPYTAYALGISIYDDDGIWGSEQLSSESFSLTLGTQIIAATNYYGKVTTEVTLKNP